MTQPKNDPITLELPAYVVDALAAWARADAQLMRPIDERSNKHLEQQVCSDLADTFVRHVLEVLPSFAAEGDLADALNERAEAYAAYRAAAYPQ